MEQLVGVTVRTSNRASSLPPTALRFKPLMQLILNEFLKSRQPTKPYHLSVGHSQEEDTARFSAVVATTPYDSAMRRAGRTTRSDCGSSAGRGALPAHRGPRAGPIPDHASAANHSWSRSTYLGSDPSASAGPADGDRWRRVCPSAAPALLDRPGPLAILLSCLYLQEVPKADVVITTQPTSPLR